jgi:hypothetical protein
LSVVFIVAPAVVVGWPVLTGAIAAAAGALGYKALNAGNRISEEESAESWVDIPMEGSQVVAEAMSRGSEFVITKGDVTATFRRAADGRCTVHVAGGNKSEAELSAIGKELLGRVTQQYAYNKTITELKKQGFTVTHEEVAADQTIRINVSKYV